MEEDIKIIEECKIMDDTIPHSEHSKRLRKAIENLIKGYRELEKERDLYKDKLKYKNEDIKRLEKEICYSQDQLSFYKKEMEKAIKQIDANLEILDISGSQEIIQELLEKK